MGRRVCVAMVNWLDGYPVERLRCVDGDGYCLDQEIQMLGWLAQHSGAGVTPKPPDMGVQAEFKGDADVVVHSQKDRQELMSSQQSSVGPCRLGHTIRDPNKHMVGCARGHLHWPTGHQRLTHRS